MGAGNHGGFGNTKGSRKNIPLDLQFFATKVFDKNGHLTEKRFEKYGTYFLGKSANKIANEMKKHGYETVVKSSTHPGSKAKRVIVKNASKDRNISVVQVSPGSKRHGETAYLHSTQYQSGRS